MFAIKSGFMMLHKSSLLLKVSGIKIILLRTSPERGVNYILHLSNPISSR